MIITICILSHFDRIIKRVLMRNSFGIYNIVELLFSNLLVTLYVYKLIVILLRSKFHNEW